MFDPIPGTIVVGVGYKARHGKSTVAKRWMQTHHAERFELSTYVATVARVMFGMRERDVAKLVDTGQSMRALYDPEVWLRCCYFDILDKRPAIAVVPNVRHVNEAQLIQQMGGTLVNVRREHEDGTPFVSDDRDPNSLMETALDGFTGWDYRITASSIRELERQADAVLAAILWRAA